MLWGAAGATTAIQGPSARTLSFGGHQRERGLTTLLCSAQPQVRDLLAITKLDALFDFVS